MECGYRPNVSYYLYKYYFPCVMIRAFHPLAPFVFFGDIMKLEPLTKTNGDTDWIQLATPRDIIQMYYMVMVGAWV
jgi:hypothetical protein